MIGQNRLYEKLNSYTINSLPKALLLIGDTGCGKHEAIKYIKNKFNLDEENFDYPFDSDAETKKNYSEKISNKIIEAQNLSIKKLYTLDLNTILKATGPTITALQVKFLKFIEEPNENVHIILIADSEVGILETILNRCIKLYFEQYSVEQLKQIKYFDNDIIYHVCKTPGQILNINQTSIEKLYSLCNLITKKIDTNNYANTLTISTLINYKEDYDKYDFNIFFNMLEYVAYKNYLVDNSELSLKIYLFTANFKQQLVGKSLVKENFMLNYLTQLWEYVR